MIFVMVWISKDYHHLIRKQLSLSGITFAEDPKNATPCLNSSTRTPPAADIYFLETSGSSKLNLRQLCAVESAAKSNPGYRVLAALLSNSNELNITRATSNILDKYKNINIVKLDFKTWLQGTPVSPETVQGRQLFECINKSAFKVFFILLIIDSSIKCGDALYRLLSLGAKGGPYQ
jgi:hypothetical protein